MPIQLRSKENLNDGKLKWLIYGKPGMGKTRTTYQLGRYCKTIVLETGGNPESTRSYPVLPDIFSGTKLSDFDTIIDYLYNGQKESHSFYKKYNGILDLSSPYEAVILDGITEVAQLTTEEILGKGSKSKDFSRIPDKMGVQDFGAYMNHITKIAKILLKELPLHVAVTALQKPITNKEFNVTGYAPAVHGQGSINLQGYALLVTNTVNAQHADRAIIETLKAEKVLKKIGTLPDEPILITQPTGLIYAKNQYGGLPKFMLNAQIEDIIAGIQGGDVLSSN